ncbi:DUF4157 domain-containing protein [Aquimarina algiphila]|uniref:eCIS core domain-containing protein n=1 Tax=Aquimarina algiphila TaxID=2047982 RepID=UPI00232C62C9|nr:DUF4157 domain-containing protein [Aquimarina algiphila]
MKKIRPRKPNKNKKEESDAFFSNAENKAKENSGNDSFFQAKLEIGDPSSPFEQEADAMADHVLQQNNEKVPGDAFGKQSVQRQAEEEEPAAKRIQRQAEEEEPAAKRIQRQAEEEESAAKRIQRQAEEEEPAAKRIQRQAEEEEPAAKQIQLQAEEEEPAAKRIQRQTEEEEPATKQIQRKMDDETTQAKGESKEKKGKKTEANAMESVEAMIQETKGQGMPLPEEIKAELEAEMKADFTNVRIHTDEKAIELSAMLNAQAFTHGYDIYFNMGKYDPYSRSGKHLLVHELTHVVQQKG